MESFWKDTFFHISTKWINVYYSFTFLQLSVKPILMQIEICILFLVEYLVIFVFFNPMFCTEIYNSLPKEKTFFHAHTRGNYNFFVRLFYGYSFLCGHIVNEACNGVCLQQLLHPYWTCLQYPDPQPNQ